MKYREESDYSPFYTFTKEDCNSIDAETRRFIDDLRGYIKRAGQSEESLAYAIAIKQKSPCLLRLHLATAKIAPRNDILLVFQRFLKIIIVFLFVFFCLLPVLASAYTYQDVQDALNNTQSSCVNWAEEVSEKRTSFLTGC